MGIKIFKYLNMKKYTYHRRPTEFEIKFGEGATHYADFSEKVCKKKKNGELKKWLISPYDKLRYYL